LCIDEVKDKEKTTCLGKGNTYTENVSKTPDSEIPTEKPKGPYRGHKFSTTRSSKGA